MSVSDNGCFAPQLLLKLWATELNERSPEEKRGFRGKLASAQHSQTVTYMKPLLRKLKKKVSQVLLSDNPRARATERQSRSAIHAPATGDALQATLSVLSVSVSPSLPLSLSKKLCSDELKHASCNGA